MRTNRNLILKLEGDHIVKIKLNMNITIEADGEQAERILENDKSALLMTIFNGNNEKRPELGKWYPEGGYTINDIFENKV